MKQRRHSHVSKVLVELELDDDVLEVPTLADPDHEDEKHKTDGVPQQASLVLYAAMNLSLRSLACHTQYTSYTFQLHFHCMLKTPLRHTNTTLTMPRSRFIANWKDKIRGLFKDLKLQFSSTKVRRSGGWKSPSGVQGRSPGVGAEPRWGLKYNVKFRPLKNRLTTRFCHVLLCIVCTILRYCWNIQIQGLFKDFQGSGFFFKIQDFQGLLKDPMNPATYTKLSFQWEESFLQFCDAVGSVFWPA